MCESSAYNFKSFPVKFELKSSHIMIYPHALLCTLYVYAIDI